MSNGLTNSIANHLCGDGFIVPNAPPFGAEEERIYIEQIKDLRRKAFDHEGNKWDNKEHATDVAAYENKRHELALKYSFVAFETAKRMSYQCHRGMGFDDLFNIGFGAILNTIDKWPPFIGGEDKGYRLLTSMKKAVSNSICRFLDDNNRPIRIPSYRLEQITIKIKKTELKKPKKPFHKDILVVMEKLDLEIDDVAGRSLKDIAVDTGRYAEIAEIVSLDVPTFISIVEPTASIDSPIGDNNETVADLITQEDQNTSSRIYKREVIESAMNELPAKNAEIICDYYFCNMSMAEIAQKNGYSKVRASQMIDKSINKIRASETAMNILNHQIMGNKEYNEK